MAKERFLIVAVQNDGCFSRFSESDNCAPILDVWAYRQWQRELLEASKARAADMSRLIASRL